MGIAREICRPADVSSEAAGADAGPSPPPTGWPGPALRRLALKLDLAIGTLTEAVGAALVVAETCHPLCRRRLALRLQQPADVDRRACQFSVSVAGDARRRRRLSPRRAHAADHLRQLAEPRPQPMARDRRRARRHRLRPRDPDAGGAVSADPAIDRADHPADLGRLPGRSPSSSARPCWRSSRCCACSKRRRWRGFVLAVAVRRRGRRRHCGWRSRC